MLNKIYVKEPLPLFVHTYTLKIEVNYSIPDNALSLSSIFSG